MRRLLVAGALVSVVLVAVTGCEAFGTTIGGPTPAQSLDAVLLAFRKAPSVDVKGNAAYRDARYGIDLSMDSASDVQGQVTLDGKTIAIMGTAARLLFEGGGYFALHGPNTGAAWVQAPSDPLVGLVGALVKRADLAGAVRAAIGDAVVTQSATAADGTKAVAYTSVASGVRVLVHTSGAQIPLEVHTPPGRNLSDDLSDLSLTFSRYGRPLVVTLPDTTINVDVPDTLPAKLAFTEQSFSYDSCDDRGCNVSVVLRNDGGRFGTATVDFVEHAGAQTLASCTVSVPPLAHGATTKVGCRLDFDRYTDSSTRYTVHNPQV